MNKDLKKIETPLFFNPYPSKAGFLDPNTSYRR